MNNTPSPNPVESLRALPEQKIVAWRWQREDDTWSLWIDEGLVSHRDSPYKKIQLAYASAPDAGLLRNAERYEIVRRLNPRDFLKLWNNCMQNDVKFDDAVDILAQHGSGGRTLNAQQEMAIKLLRQRPDRDLYMAVNHKCYVTYTGDLPESAKPELTIEECKQLEAAGLIREKWPNINHYWVLV